MALFTFSSFRRFTFLKKMRRKRLKRRRATKGKNYREMKNAVGDDTEEKWITHYSSSHLILLVGEGDFSFSACLARAFGSGTNMVATSLDSKESLLKKYSLAKEYLEELKLLGCTIFHEVDVAFMSRQPPLNSMCFDRIVFNFPHAGFYFSECVDYQIRLHRDLVTEFLRNAKEMLSENGEIHITHKTAHPYSQWEIVKLAEEVGLYLVRKVPFDLLRYWGYANKRGDGRRCDASFDVGESSTFMFRKLQIVYPRSSGLVYYHLFRCQDEMEEQPFPIHVRKHWQDILSECKDEKGWKQCHFQICSSSSKEGICGDAHTTRNLRKIRALIDCPVLQDFGPWTEDHQFETFIFAEEPGF